MVKAEFKLLYNRTSLDKNFKPSVTSNAYGNRGMVTPAIETLTLLRAGAILFVTVPATIITSDCLGVARNTTPNRSISYRGAAKCIISTAQQARPKDSGHKEL